MSVADSPTSDEEAPEWLSLDADERVAWSDHPSRVSVLPGIVWGIVLLPLFGIGLLVLGSTILRVRNTDYVVTDEALYVKRGVLSTTIESVTLEKIQNTAFRRSFLGRRFGYGSIDVSTAGSSGTDLSFTAVEDARSVRETITRLRSQSTSSSRRSRSEAAEAPSGSMGELLVELRATREALERAERALRDRRDDSSKNEVAVSSDAVEGSTEVVSSDEAEGSTEMAGSNEAVDADDGRQ